MEHRNFEELVEEVRWAEYAHIVGFEPKACHEIGVLFQETRRPIPALFRAIDLCKKCISESEHPCSETLMRIKPDIILCRFIEALTIGGFNNPDFQILKNHPGIRDMVHRAFEAEDLPILSEILPLNQLRDESLLLNQEKWESFISDGQTKKEASEILQFYINLAVDYDPVKLTEFTNQCMYRRIKEGMDIEGILEEQRNSDQDKLFMLVLRRVYFALTFLAGEPQYRDLYDIIGSNQPLIPGGMEQCGLWLQRVAIGCISVTS